MKLCEDARGRVGIDGVGLAGEHFAGGAVERQPVAFLQGERLAADGDGDLLLVLV